MGHGMVVELFSPPSLARLRLLKTMSGKKIKIIDMVAPRWKYVGDLMNFDQTGETLDQIQKREASEESRCRKMFQLWLEGKGVKPVSWATVLAILEDSDLKELAYDIKSFLTYEFQCMCVMYDLN